MKVVLLVGAGATLAEARPRQPSQKEQPPLDTTFFRLCRLNDFDGGHDLRRYLKSSYGIDPYKGKHRMEEIFNYIYTDTHSPGSTRLCRQAYWGLIRMYAKAIAVTTNPLNGNSRYGVGAVLRNLWKADSVSDISFITFNQDMMIEKAVEYSMTEHPATYGDFPWSIDSCYHVDFDDVDPVRKNATKFTTGSDAAMPLLKLHGSLNWIYESTFGSYKELLEFLENPPTGKLVCQNDQTLYEELKYTGGRKTQRTIPFIVPPVYDKDPHSHEVLRPVWAKANAELRSADRLVIFGYSFPETDVAAQTLLKRSYYANDNMSTVTIIDIDSSTASRIADLLGSEAVYYFGDVRSFVNDLRG